MTHPPAFQQRHARAIARGDFGPTPEPYRHPLPIMQAPATHPPSPGMSLAALFALRVIQVTACCALGAVGVVAVIILREMTR